MDRISNQEDRIKRAEEIYYRKNYKINNENMVGSNVEQSRYRFIRKILTQILLSMCIYMFFSMAQDGNWRYSKEIIDKTKEILSYNINFKEYYEIFTNNIDKKEEIGKENNTIEEENIEETQEPELIEVVSGVSQMVEDSVYIKENQNIIKPVSGTITSKFGVRDDVGSSYHLGLDIGANEGTDVVAAMSGTVQIASEEGNYGKHIKIANGNISTLYAHLNNIFVKEGEEINQGQKIAEVGSTGYSTGPHLHFEIMCDDRYVDPELILEF